MNLDKLRVLHNATNIPGATAAHELVHDLIREHLGVDSDADDEHAALQPASDGSIERIGPVEAINEIITVLNNEPWTPDTLDAVDEVVKRFKASNVVEGEHPLMDIAKALSE